MRIASVRLGLLSLFLIVALQASQTVFGQAVTGAEKNTDGISVHCGTALLQLQPWSDRIVRVHFAPTGQLSVPVVSAVIGKPDAIAFDVIDQPEYVGLKTKAIEARVNRATGAVSFVDASNGRVFLSEAASGRSTSETKVGDQTIHGPAQVFVRQPDEAIIGLGQHQDGQFNYRDANIRLLQENTKIGVPVLTSSAGYLLLWDNAAVTNIETKKDSVKWSSEFGANTDYYICYGPDLNDAIAGYRKLTGDAPMFGRWAWGLWQSRERYVTQKDTLAIAKEYRDRHIPIDGVVQDWQYWFPQPWGSHAFGTNFPDPSGLVKQLHGMNYHTLISVWAKFDMGSKNFDEMEAAGNLYPPIYNNVAPKGRAKWYDPFKPEARAMYWRQMNEQIAVHGWDGWWLDATEPELGGKWGEMRNLQTAAGPGYAVFNAYPLMTTTAVYQGQKARTPEVRPFILTRSAYAGQQRNGAVAWSGDIAGNWNVFRKQIPAGLNFVASGIPYWNTDTGGFFGGHPTDPEYRELFTRWFQFSTFCPMLRIHGTGDHKPLWAFGEAHEKILTRFDHLRYRLIPYIYSTSWQVTNHHASMMRPLLIDYRDDVNVHNIGDQFLFGPGLMVCPVTDPIGNNLALVPPANLIDAAGHPGGLSATYYQGQKFEKEITRRTDSAIDFDWDKTKREGVGANARKDPIPGLKMDDFSARWEGSLQTTSAGSYTLSMRGDDGFRLFVDGKLLFEDWNARPVLTKTARIDLPANTRVPIKIEYFQNIHDAIIDLRWQPPASEKPVGFTRKVYLPQGQWFDFWTGQSITGGKTIDAPAPIEQLPLYVKAGSIIPMGPVVQYASEKPDAPLEVRVYPGADATFTLYDDAGDGYGYERGEYATIPLQWNDQTQTLTIAERTGTYPGMAKERQFNIVIVKPTQGTGIEETKNVGPIIKYNGAPATVTVKPPSPVK